MNAVTAYNAHPGMFEIKEIRDVAFANYDPNAVWVHKASNTDLDIENIIYQALYEYTEVTRKTELITKEIQPGIRVYQPGLNPTRLFQWKDDRGRLLITARALGLVLTIYACQQLSYTSQWSLFYERHEKVLRKYAESHKQRKTMFSGGFSWM